MSNRDVAEPRRFKRQCILFETSFTLDILSNHRIRRLPLGDLLGAVGCQYPGVYCFLKSGGVMTSVALVIGYLSLGTLIYLGYYMQ
jgi:hypothetical protein